MRPANFAALVLVGCLLVGQAQPAAAADAILYANNVSATAQLTLPQPIWLPDASGGHLWVGDSVFGFCRIDGPAGGPSAINASTCDQTAPKAAQAAFDKTNNLLYIADDSTSASGVVRIGFNPAGSGSIVRGSGVRIGDPGRANSVALNPADGELYIGYVKGTEIKRVANPASASPGQPTEIVARTSDGRGVRGGLAFVCDSRCDLYIGEVGGNGVTLGPDATNCNPFGASAAAVGGCEAVLTAITTNQPGGLTSDGTSLFVGDAPLTNSGTLLRYNPSAGTQDVLSTNVAPYAATYPSQHSQMTFTQITGIAVAPNGDVYVGDDPTVGAVNPAPLQQGRVWRLAGIASSQVDCKNAPGAGCVDQMGYPGAPAMPRPPAALSAPGGLVAWGATSPHGAVWIPGALGGHYWVSDHTQGLCRLDRAPTNTGLYASNPQACDPTGNRNGIIGSPGQPVFDSSGNFIYVPDQAVKSPGVWRLNFDPSTETISNPTLMAPGSGLQDDKPDSLALGLDGKLYASGLKSGGVWRIDNPRGDPNTMAVTMIGQTSDGRGINGTMGFLGGDLYLPENRGLGVIPNAAGCSFCTSSLLSIPGVAFAASVATDNAHGAVYVSVAPGAANATIYRYKPSSGSVIYATQAQLPKDAAGPSYVEDCTETCQRVPEPGIPADGLVGFHFPLGMYVDPNNGNLIVLDDPMAGVRGFHGHVYAVPFTP
jgi:hypothetical protein